MTANKLIALTGLDGSGKSFVARYLHKLDPGSFLVGTPTTPFQPARLAIDNFALSVPAAHYFFYLASVIHVSFLLDNMLKEGNVYCDRYLIDTVVYHRAMGLPVELAYETPLYKIKQPDLTIFLEIINEHVRQDRIEMRGKKTVGDKIVDQKQIREAILAEYEKLSNHFIKINNTDRDIIELATDVRRYL